MSSVRRPSCDGAAAHLICIAAWTAALQSRRHASLLFKLKLLLLLLLLLLQE